MLKVKTLCSDEAENLTELPLNTVLISFSNENEEPWELQITDNVHKQTFADVRARIWYKNKYYNPINQDQACEILQFIIDNKDKNIWINCAAGYSRSAGAAVAINLLFGHELDKDFWEKSGPNEFVIGILINQYFKHFKKD